MLLTCLSHDGFIVDPTKHADVQSVSMYNLGGGIWVTAKQSQTSTHMHEGSCKHQMIRFAGMRS